MLLAIYQEYPAKKDRIALLEQLRWGLFLVSFLTFIYTHPYHAIVINSYSTEFVDDEDQKFLRNDSLFEDIKCKDFIEIYDK